MQEIELHEPEIEPERLAELERWLEDKKGTIGGSSAAAAVGLGRFGSRLQLWGEMTGRIERPDLSVNDAVRMGSVLEGPVTDELDRRSEFRLQVDDIPEVPVSVPSADHVGAYDFKEDERSRFQHLFRSREREWQTYSPDGFAWRDTELGLVETKTTGLFPGRDWNDGPPEEVLIQVAHGMAVTGLPWAVIPVLIGGQAFRVFFVERDEELCELVCEREAELMAYVANNVPPPVEDDEGPATLKALKLLYPKDDKSRIELPDVGWDSVLQDMRERRLSIEKGELAIECLIREAMGEAAYADIPGEPLHEYTLRSVNVKEYTVAASIRRSLGRRKKTTRTRSHK